jgi:hypothetical protein
MFVKERSLLAFHNVALKPFQDSEKEGRNPQDWFKRVELESTVIRTTYFGALFDETGLTQLPRPRHLLKAHTPLF